jgi:hypothetical protein
MGEVFEVPQQLPLDDSRDLGYWLLLQKVLEGKAIHRCMADLRINVGMLHSFLPPQEAPVPQPFVSSILFWINE